jgi:hypothetical protein
MSASWTVLASVVVFIWSIQRCTKQCTHFKTKKKKTPSLISRWGFFWGWGCSPYHLTVCSIIIQPNYICFLCVREKATQVWAYSTRAQLGTPKQVIFNVWQQCLAFHTEVVHAHLFIVPEQWSPEVQCQINCIFTKAQINYVSSPTMYLP